MSSDPLFEKRPWGGFRILSDKRHYKSKWLQVTPGAQLSYQSHEQREEHWVVVSGSGLVILNDQSIPIQVGSYVHIPRKAKHRLRNTGTTHLEIIEVQLGEYFGEDDIHRYEDDYHRL